MKNAQNAKIWLLGQFSKFYLIDKLNPLVEFLTEENFVTEISNFVTQNKAFAEEQINKNNPDQASVLIAELNSLNYELMKATYVTLYDQVDPLPAKIIPLNPDGKKYLAWLSSDVKNFGDYGPIIFEGGLDLNNPQTMVMINASLDALPEIQHHITNLRNNLT